MNWLLEIKMHQKKYPHLKEEIEQKYKLVYDKKVLPSMRSMQFGGKPIEISPNRIYNCAYLPIEHIDSFSETMFLLLGEPVLDILYKNIMLQNYLVFKNHTQKERKDF